MVTLLVAGLGVLGRHGRAKKRPMTMTVDWLMGLAVEWPKVVVVLFFDDSSCVGGGSLPTSSCCGRCRRPDVVSGFSLYHDE